MIKKFAIIIELRSFKQSIHVQKRTFSFLIGFLLIAMIIDLNVAQDNNARTLLTKVLDSFTLIPYLRKLSPATDVMDYVIRSVQKNLIIIIHTALNVSTLFYTINIRTPIHHGKITFVLQAILKLTELKMISLHLRSSNKIIQDTNSFWLNKQNFELLLHQSALFQHKFGTNFLIIYMEYFTHAELIYFFNVFYKIYLMVCFVIFYKCYLQIELQLQSTHVM